MKDAVLTYWLTAIDPNTHQVVWERPVNGIVSENEEGQAVGIKVVETPYGRPPQGNFIFKWEPAWQVVETRPEKIIGPYVGD